MPDIVLNALPAKSTEFNPHKNFLRPNIIPPILHRMKPQLDHLSQWFSTWGVYQNHPHGACENGACWVPSPESLIRVVWGGMRWGLNDFYFNMFPG